MKHGYGEYRRTWFLENEGEVDHPLTKKPVLPRFLGGVTPQIAEDADRRAILAGWIVAPENPYFARATVNRIWHEYFNTGIVEPFDDFRLHQHADQPTVTGPPGRAVHPERISVEGITSNDFEISHLPGL